MKLIVGLGNPGKKYENTRHNLGFMVVEKLGALWEMGRESACLPARQGCEGGKWVFNKKFKVEYCLSKTGVVLARPQVSMNVSGFAVIKLADFYKIKSEDIWIIHDDVDLPLGKIKIRLGGAAAGHRGVESIIAQLGIDRFVRFRLGINHPKKNVKLKVKNSKLVEGYVLSRFRPGEKSTVKRMIKKAVEAIEVALEEGLEKAMNQFNP